jgi:hypothetical protein
MLFSLLSHEIESKRIEARDEHIRDESEHARAAAGVERQCYSETKWVSVSASRTWPELLFAPDWCHLVRRGDVERYGRAPSGLTRVL